MAILHRATLAPTKRELVASWLPGRPWAPPGPIASGVSYRLDDPAGEVGMEGFLFTDTGGDVVHVPLTYRGEPLDGPEQHLLGTMEHSVLGTRWVYDGCGDPVWVSALVATILTGGAQAEELVDVDGTLQKREPTVRVLGSGDGTTPVPRIGSVRLEENETSTTVTADGLELVVVRRVGAEVVGPLSLTATWDGVPGAVLLAALRLRP